MYIYRMSNIYIRRPISISDVRYIFQTLDIPALALALAEVRYVLYFRRRIYILEVQYIYWTSDIDFGNIGVILSQMAPHTNPPSSSPTPHETPPPTFGFVSTLRRISTELSILIMHIHTYDCMHACE